MTIRPPRIPCQDKTAYFTDFDDFSTGYYPPFCAFGFMPHWMPCDWIPSVRLSSKSLNRQSLRASWREKVGQVNMPHWDGIEWARSRRE
jgi:hypothetical protein